LNLKIKITAFCSTLALLAACSGTAPTPAPGSSPLPTTPSSIPSIIPTPSIPPELAAYAFPVSIDPSARYLFYLHGKIIEDQGLHASSPDYGDYEYLAILEELASHGFIVISEQRPVNTDGIEYAHKIAGQAGVLLNAGVPAKNITVVGASKGAGIAIYVSHFLENKEMNFVILGICAADTVQGLEQTGIFLHGNVLSIYDASDNLAGSCQELFTFSKDRGLARNAEIVLHVGTGHGILYQPLDEWVLPTVQWVGEN
jgi:hypothetical protein